MAKKVILKTNIKRDRNKLYCCGTSADDTINIMEVERSKRSQGISNKK